MTKLRPPTSAFRIRLANWCAQKVEYKMALIPETGGEVSRGTRKQQLFWWKTLISALPYGVLHLILRKVSHSSLRTPH